jgi:glycogen operon protein
MGAPQDGLPYPMGATPVRGGVNFAVFSAHATDMWLCLFDPSGRVETGRIRFGARTGDVWHMHVAGLSVGQLYGLRAHGPYAPDQGHRFNMHKLLIDPYTRAFQGRLRWSDALMGYRVGAAKADLGFDTRDSAFAMPKCQIIDTSFDWQGDGPLRTPLRDTVIY